MSDNVSVTPGAGAIIATRDSGGGVEVQRVIPNTWDGVNALDISASNPMPVTITGATGTPVPVSVSGTAVVSASTVLPVGGAVAVGAAATGNPVLEGISDGTNVAVRTGNIDNITVIASAAFTTTQTSADRTNNNHRGGYITLNVTSAGTGSVTLSVQGKDPLSGSYYTLLTGAAVITNSTNVYSIYPGITTAANAAVATMIPRTWRVIVTANNANTITYSVGASMVI